MTLGEDLSRLWSGELPADEAAALEHRIATEPAVAEQWARLGRAMAALEALPDAMTPPPLRTTHRPAARVRTRTIAPLLLAAAAAAALWFVPRADPVLVLVDGAQWVDGDVRLAAGDAEIDVDGKVWISVEPAAPLARVGVPNVEDPMNKSTIVAGLAGALVTIVVYEGTAVVRAESGPAPVVVGAGETHHTRLPGTPAPAVAATPEARAENIARLQAELAEVQNALAEARFQGALTRGQLAAMQGTPSPWPDGVPAELTPGQFREKLEATLADVEDVEIAEVDCDEYPCVAAIRYTGASAEGGWNQPIADATRAWLGGVIGEHMSISTNVSEFRNDDSVERYVLVGAHEADGDSDVRERTEFRIDGMVDELGSRLGGGE
jgi:anti-sigma factor RsiW